MPGVAIDTNIEAPLQVLILVVVVIAVVTDVRSRRIPNSLTFPAMAFGLALNAWWSGLHGLLLALGGLLLGAALFFVPVAAGGRGAGDLKLVAAVGALGGLSFVFWCVLFASMAGGIFAVALLLIKKRFFTVVNGWILDLYVQQLPRATSNIRLPYAIPIALGAVAALFLRP